MGCASNIIITFNGETDMTYKAPELPEGIRRLEGNADVNVVGCRDAVAIAMEALQERIDNDVYEDREDWQEDLGALYTLQQMWVQSGDQEGILEEVDLACYG